MLTVRLKNKTLVFMDFYPCKAKDLPAKMDKVIKAVEGYTARGYKYGYTRKNKSNVF